MAIQFVPKAAGKPAPIPPRVTHAVTQPVTRHEARDAGRGETALLRQEVARLRQELDAARAEIARLKGGRPPLTPAERAKAYRERKKAGNG